MHRSRPSARAARRWPTEPASALAQESLLDALDTKVALLQDTVALATDTGDTSDDAAAAAKELNQ